jgi:hypothetical protein
MLRKARKSNQRRPLEAVRFGGGLSRLLIQRFAEILSDLILVEHCSLPSTTTESNYGAPMPIAISWMPASCFGVSVRQTNRIRGDSHENATKLMNDNALV